MEQDAADTIASIVDQDTWTIEDHMALAQELGTVTDAIRKFREMLADMEGENPAPKGAVALKIGIARFMLCRFDGALEVLAKATDNADRQYFIAQCYRGMRQYAQAAEAFQTAKAKGCNDPKAHVYAIESLALAGDLDAAQKLYKKVASGLADTADDDYVRGLLLEIDGQGEQAIEAYDAACDKDSNCVDAKFRLAYYLDLHGDDEEAMELYKQCLEGTPVYANAMMNLAVLYDDHGEYDKAIDLLEQLLKNTPNHPRAQLYLRDTEASTVMLYDEDQVRRMAKRSAVLDIPVTDFELSVRARNCLKKMNIATLGDLVSTSEAELLGYKNFGETSLKEIKEMLTAKGLRLGQALEEGADFLSEAAKPQIEGLNEGVGATPIAQIEFSVRARRVLEQMNIQTIGELAARSEAELMAMKNFGQTSLNEMRQRLREFSLGFRDSM